MTISIIIIDLFFNFILYELTIGGAGLGLAIAKEIVVLHEGEIYANSDEQHTRFTVVSLLC